MTRKQWIAQLRKALKNLPPHIVDEIIEDYNEHFENGIYMGKSEQDIARELGNPKEVAKEYLGYSSVSWREQLSDSPILKVLISIVFIIGLITIFPYAVDVTSSLIKGIFWFLLFVILVGLLVSAILIACFSHKFKEGFGSFRFINNTSSEASYINLRKEQYFSNIKEVIVNSNIGNLVISPSDNDNFEATVKGYSDIEIEEIQMIVTGSTLTIDFGKEKEIRIHKNNGIKIKIEVKIPKAALNDIKVHSSLGNIEINESFDYLKVTASLGNIKINSPQKDVNIKASMGTIRLNNFDGYGIIKNSMGNVYFEDMNQFHSDMTINITMGNIKNTNPNVILNQTGKNTYFVQGKDSTRQLKVNLSMGNVKIK
jgi:uncharacterized membrane protein